MDIADLENRLNSLQDHLQGMQDSIGQSKATNEIIKLLVYFWAAISAVVGFIGYQQLSNIERIVDNEISLNITKNQSSLKQYEELIGKTKELNQKLQDAQGSLEKAQTIIGLSEATDDRFDIDGKIDAILKESDSEENIQDLTWRAKAIKTIQIFADSLKDRTVSTTDIFNVTIVCRQLKQHDLALSLTKLAFERDPTPSNKALFLSEQIEYSSNRDGGQAFVELMDLVRQLTQDSPQIVVGEAWNAAETRRDYIPFLHAIDDFINSIDDGHPIRSNDVLDFVPSYVYAIRAQTRFRIGSPAALREAVIDIKKAADLLSGESPTAQWYDTTKSKLAWLTGLIDLEANPSGEKVSGTQEHPT